MVVLKVEETVFVITWSDLGKCMIILYDYFNCRCGKTCFIFEADASTRSERLYSGFEK